ncbi:MAG: site-2 protease family protein [Pirellulales bacterium]|nr:site-2 protease family protein [Pirellulales bacterium]
MYLIAATSPTEWLLVILQVALGLGAVIFVHELGHFAVAKMCGVKCDKFFVGFDIGGYKISRKWGETEYGIGILPLGGYVKMLGQDDNPANIAEQMKESQVSGDSAIQTKEIYGPDGAKYVVDSRSYLAKSVPQRMAIISAGVIMNVIFAFFFAVIAFGLGVPYVPCIVSSTSPGSAAYQAAIRPGDEILAVEDIKNPSFAELMSGVSLGDLQNGVPFTLRRAASGEVETIILKPRLQDDKLARVGIFSPSSLRLVKEKPVSKFSPAANASEEFLGGDEIIAVNGKPVADYREFTAQLVELSDQPLDITVRRGGKAPAGDRFGPRQGGKEITISVPAQPLRRLGLVMEMGKIVAVEQGSLAAEKGIQAGDFIEKVSAVEDAANADPTADQPYGDPMALPEQLRKLAGETGEIRLSVRRSSASEDGRQTTEIVDLPLRQVNWLEVPRIDNDPLSIPALGIAYRVLNRVDSALPGSPAARAGLRRGDVILKAEYVHPQKEKWMKKPVTFGEKGQHNWPAFVHSLHHLPGDAQVKLTYKRGAAEHHVTLQPEDLPDEFVPERGFVFASIQRERIARSFREQLQLGWKETMHSLGMVVRFLGKLGTQIPLTALGGPVTIAQVAGYSAFEGVGKLLVFLTMLSANLAVINFLPIPLLDGGHMVFLTWEGIRGRPASERFVLAMHTAGFVFVITLMLFVITLDIRRLLGFALLL